MTTNEWADAMRAVSGIKPHPNTVAWHGRGELVFSDDITAIGDAIIDDATMPTDVEAFCQRNHTPIPFMVKKEFEYGFAWEPGVVLDEDATMPTDDGVNGDA